MKRIHILVSFVTIMCCVFSAKAAEDHPSDRSRNYGKTSGKTKQHTEKPYRRRLKLNPADVLPRKAELAREARKRKKEALQKLEANYASAVSKIAVLTGKNNVLTHQVAQGAATIASLNATITQLQQTVASHIPDLATQTESLLQQRITALQEQVFQLKVELTVTPAAMDTLPDSETNTADAVSPEEPVAFADPTPAIGLLPALGAGYGVPTDFDYAASPYSRGAGATLDDDAWIKSL